MIPSAETILNVDDTEAVRYAKTRTLRHAGFKVVEAASGREALQIVADQRPALVLLDINLPDISGLEVCDHIKRDFPEIVVLQTSAHFVSPGHRVRGLEGGADAYLTQPAEPDELIATVQALLRTRRAEDRLRRSEARMRLAQESGDVGSWEWDLDTEKKVCSAHNYHLIGVEPGTDLDTIDLEALIHPDDRDRVVAAFRATMSAGDPLSIEFRVVRPTDGVRWLLTRAELHDRDTPRRGRLVGINIDLTERKLAEARQRVLIQELHHRVKNTLAIVQSIARQTLRGSTGDPAALEAFELRLANLARTHDLLMQNDLIGGTLHAIVAEAAAPYAGRDPGRFSASGPSVEIEPRVAVALAMALHELWTNASKYGALSVEDGRIELTWGPMDDEEQRLRIVWREIGGPPVAPPARVGFGSKLIERVLAHELDGAASLDFRPDGLVCTIEVGRPQPVAHADLS